MPPPCRAEQRDRRLGDVVDAPEVGLELGAEVVVVDGLDRRDVGVARVVDDHVDTPEAGDAPPRSPHGLRRVGDVERERQHAVAVLGDQASRLFGAARGRDDAVARGERRRARARPKPREEPVMNQVVCHALSDNSVSLITQRVLLSRCRDDRRLPTGPQHRGEAAAGEGDPRRRPRARPPSAASAGRRSPTSAEVVGMHKSAMLRYFETRELTSSRLTATGWRTGPRGSRASWRRTGTPSPPRSPRCSPPSGPRPMFCDLLAQAPLNLERNVSLETVRASSSSP